MLLKITLIFGLRKFQKILKNWGVIWEWPPELNVYRWSPDNTTFWSKRNCAKRNHAIHQSEMHALLNLVTLAGMIKVGIKLIQKLDLYPFKKYINKAQDFHNLANRSIICSCLLSLSIQNAGTLLYSITQILFFISFNIFIHQVSFAYCVAVELGTTQWIFLLSFQICELLVNHATAWVNR